MFNLLYPMALKIGISVFEFWDYTLAELLDLFEAYRQRKEEETKNKLAENYNLAYMVSIFNNRADQGKPPPSLQQIFPNMFEELENDEETKKQNELIILKERMLDFAEIHNKGG